MNSKRLNYLLIGIIVLLSIGLLAGGYGVNNLLQAKAKKLLALKLQDAVLVEQQAGLAKAKREVAANKTLEAIATTVVPQDKDQAEAVREIASLANESGISQLSSVTFPASTLGKSAVKSSGASASTTAPTTSSANSAANKLTQLLPVPGIAGVYQLQITINQSSDNLVSYDQFITFLTKLEQNRRTAQVSGITLQPDAKNPNMVAFTLILNEFIKP